MNKTNNNTTESGNIVSFFQGVAKLKGLPHVFLHEMLVDKEKAAVAFVIGFDEEFVEALFFDESFDPKEKVFRSGELFSVPITEKLIGRTISGIGKPIDDFGPLRGSKYPVFRKAPPIIDREPVRVPLTTGIKIIDTVLPLGRGQRELLIGDRKLGKSTIAIDIVLNQKNASPSVICVYVVCGQKRQKLEDILTLFEKKNAFLHTIVVAATAGSSFGELYLAPFVGCAIGEYLRDKGRDALVIYDDLSKHAMAYRDIALLLGRAPGREAYPGDIFSLHAGLLERAAKLSQKKGGGSLTALPIIETQEGDITAFIPTNLISITDGQIYFERGLFQKGFLPAVNIGLSVSRVGSQAQPKSLQEVTGGIRLALAQHKELQRLAQLETTKSEEAKKSIHRGELLLELLKQEKHTRVSWPEQAILFYTMEEGHFDDLEKSSWKRFEELFLEFLRNRYFETILSVEKNGFTDSIEEAIKNIVTDFKNEFIS
jgi:F-type H+-transporting ATPase subunit alpha